MRNGEWPELNPSELKWAQLAAFIDGEGSILFTERHYKGKPYVGMYIRVVIANTDPRLPRWCSENFGGVFVVGDRRRKPNHRLAYKWHVSCRHAEWVLRGCLPHFVLKKEQAEIALAFQETIRPSAKGRGASLPEAVWNHRKALKEELHKLRWQSHDVAPEVPSVPMEHISTKGAEPKELVLN
jgi:hypothetical protein